MTAAPVAPLRMPSLPKSTDDIAGAAEHATVGATVFAVAAVRGEYPRKGGENPHAGRDLPTDSPDSPAADALGGAQ